MQNIKSPVAGRVTTAERRSPRAPLAYRLAHLIGRPALRLLFRFEITGRHHVPQGVPLIVVANHLNWLDAFALLLALPVEPQVHLIGWDSALDAPKLSMIIRLTRAGFIPVARERTRRSHQRRQVHRILTSHLRGGGVLAIFPEGSVGQVEGALRPLEPGFANLACSSGAAVLPVALSGTRRLWLRKRIKVVIGSPIAAGSHSRESLARETNAALALLLPAYTDPGGLKLFERRLTELIPALTDWRAGSAG